MGDKLLVVVDMQYDFVMPNGSLYLPGADRLIVPIIEHILSFDAEDVVYTRDTHSPIDYHLTAEAKLYPAHCLFGTPGREIVVPVRSQSKVLDKSVFDVWAHNGDYLQFLAQPYHEIEIVGVAADVCVDFAYKGFTERGHAAAVRGDLTLGIWENPYG